MFRFLFRLAFRVVSLVLLLGIAFVVYHLYTSGQLPYIQRAVEDTAVTGSVKAAFAVHRDLSKRPIEIETDRRVVRLSGEVASEQERESAEELAANVDGVEGVENRMLETGEVRLEHVGTANVDTGQVDEARLARDEDAGVTPAEVVRAAALRDHDG